MMKDRLEILLIYPPNSGARPGVRGIYFPLGIGYVASVLRKDYVVKVHDFNYDFCMGYYSGADYVEKILKSYKYDFLLIGGVFPKYKCIKEIIDVSRKLFNAPVIMGGSYLKSSINVLADYLKADYYVIGDGEEVIQKLLNHIIEKRPVDEVDGIAYINNNNDVVVTKPAEPSSNVDDIPFPARDLFDFHRYKRYFALGNPLVYSAHVISSRGCPYNCLFCNPAFGRTVRVRSPENIMEEVQLLQKDYNCKFIFFHDEVLLGGTKKRAAAFCEYILSKNKHKFFWGGTTNARMLDEETLKLMKKAGCIRISLGVESGSEEILKEMRKRNNLEQIKNIVAICNKLGIETDFSLLTNTFSETEDTLCETKNFLKHFNQFYFREPFSINYVTPVHGTDMYNEAKKRGLIKDEDINYMLSMSEGSRYKLKYNLTNLETNYFIKLTDEINQELAEDYFNRHSVQKLIFKYTNLTHFRLKETLTSLSPQNVRPLVEGILWALCRGNDNSLTGKVYKKMVYKNVSA